VTRVTGFVARNPVAAYCALTFAISWGGVLLGLRLLVHGLAFAAALWVVIGAVAAANRRQISRQPRPRQAA
jgi:hypothetical protein